MAKKNTSIVNGLCTDTIPCQKDYTEGGEYLGYETTANEKWIRLHFDDGAVVLWAVNWNIPSTDCPDGIKVGKHYDLRWERIDERRMVPHIKQLD